MASTTTWLSWKFARLWSYTIDDFDPEVGNHFRKAVDELTTKLGMACSQLGYLAHNPQDKPNAAGQKADEGAGIQDCQG